MHRSKYLMAFLILFSPAAPALAYVGPGMSLGVLSVMGGVFLSILLAAYAAFWFPFKRLMKRRREAQDR